MYFDSSSSFVAKNLNQGWKALKIGLFSVVIAYNSAFNISNDYAMCARAERAMQWNCIRIFVVIEFLLKENGNYFLSVKFSLR